MNNKITLIKDRRKERKKYKINSLLIKSPEKYKVIIRRTCKHFYAFVVKNGLTIAYVNTISKDGVKREKDLRRNKVKNIALEFSNKIREYNNNINYSDLLYDYSFCSFSGCVLTFINTVKDVLKK
ncbi:hypothetical protein AB837_00149 [bacterium AB1]|nr:hypothetical protein AB837_00149 [bacterium AB1]